MGFIIVVVALFFLLYPVIVVAVMSSKRTRALEGLKEQVARLRGEVLELTQQLIRVRAEANAKPPVEKAAPPAPAPTAAPAPTPVPVPVPVAPLGRPIDIPAAAAAIDPPARTIAAVTPAVAEPAAAPAPTPAPQYAPAAPPRDEVRAPRVERLPDPIEPPPAPPYRGPGWITTAKNWMFSGNVVAKFGLLILFIGVSFLMKYVVEEYTVAIEVRLAAVVLADIGLLAWGWRIRESRRDIGLPVQGAAIGILMLVTFAAFSYWKLIGAAPAFVLLAALTGFTCVLAVLQNAPWLAVFGITGGFLSPIMLSTGKGNHIALFTYYAVLNAGILAMALKRAWRGLNLLGFAFTFGIGAAWGGLKYVPENYLSAQAFLILFFLFYVGIAIAFALRQAPRLKYYVDGTLVFGTPVLGFGMQYGLVKDQPFGLAFSALALGVFYIGLAMAMWQRRAGNLRILVEAFLALGIVFGSLAIPFSFDGRWTSAAWALEGAGIVWVGLRQKNKLSWAFGLLLQLGAWVSFIAAISGLDQTAMRNDNLWLGFAVLTVSAFAMAVVFRAQKDDEGEPVYPTVALGFLAIAAVWMMAGAWVEIGLRSGGALRTNLFVASGMFTALVLALIERFMRWPQARRFAVVAQLVASVPLLAAIFEHWRVDANDQFRLEHLLPASIGVALIALYTSWVRRPRDTDVAHNATGAAMLAWFGLWWFVPTLGIAQYFIATQAAFEPLRGQALLWIEMSIFSLGVAASVLTLSWLARRLAWPALRWFGPLVWIWLLVFNGRVVLELVGHGALPAALTWAVYAALWLVTEYTLRLWASCGWSIGRGVMQALHLVRVILPWLMIWPLGRLLIGSWLDVGQSSDLSGLEVSGSWSHFVPAWFMMIAIVVLARLAQNAQWPTTPISDWYRRVPLPIGTALALLLVLVWNLGQNGAMAPLPYVPLLNPLDLTTAFAAVLAIVCYRMLAADGLLQQWRPGAVKLTAGLFAYGWFNLILLRSASNYLDIEYRIGPMVASQFVQAMLSLVWSVSALLLMRRAATRLDRTLWLIGAGLLGVVVAKLFLIDQSNVGSVARIVSFVGVGLLMLLIGYLAPYPSHADSGDTKKASA